MIVCSCNVLSDARIKSALEAASGAARPRSPTAVYKCLGCSPNCGRCFKTIRKIIDERLDIHHAPEAGCGAGCAAACGHGPELASAIVAVYVGEASVILQAAE